MRERLVKQEELLEFCLRRQRSACDDILVNASSSIQHIPVALGPTNHLREIFLESSL